MPPIDIPVMQSNLLKDIEDHLSKTKQDLVDLWEITYSTSLIVQFAI